MVAPTAQAAAEGDSVVTSDTFESATRLGRPPLAAITAAPDSNAPSTLSGITEEESPPPPNRQQQHGDGIDDGGDGNDDGVGREASH